jgi:hypothetical protein
MLESDVSVALLAVSTYWEKLKERRHVKCESQCLQYNPVGQENGVSPYENIF